MYSQGTEAGLCVYGIVRAGEAAPISVTGIDGRPVTAIESGPLAAHVSDKPPGPLQPSRRNLMAHTRVLQEAAAATTVLPMRFGVVMPDEASVRHELLGERERERLAQLRALDGLVELDLKIVCPEEVLMRRILAEQPDLAREDIARASAQKRRQLTELVLDRIGPLAVRSDVGEPAHDQMLVNVAFLVRREQVEGVEAVVGSVNDELGPGLRLSCVGPMPPHRFVGAGIDSCMAASEALP